MKKKYSSTPRFISTLAILLITILLLPPKLHAKGISDILSSIKDLEGRKDPKCYATASRLENFMYGTPLTDAARFAKNNLQAQWVNDVWERASNLAKQNKQTDINAEHIKTASKSILDFSKNTFGDWEVKFQNSDPVVINKVDERQYGSIAYSLRAILAAQQKSEKDPSKSILPLSKAAIDELKLSLDIFTLAVLKQTDQQARLSNSYTLEKDVLVSTWERLSGLKQQTSENNISKVSKPIKLELLNSIIKQKISSYEAYNKISNQLFVRNLQVYFARSSWPKDPEVGKQFKGLFTESMIAFAADLYKGAEANALKKGHAFIEESDVSDFVQRFIPHHINDYEDAIFFPALEPKDRIEIESYDMDAFRDTGIHWRYLQYAIDDPEFKAFLEPDPFASELIVENIAQFGVLALRMTGVVGKKQGKKRIELDHFSTAIKEIQSRINLHQKVANQTKQIQQSTISSVESGQRETKQQTYFSDVTEDLGIDFMHRSSDWLNRLLRSYLKKDSTTGIITIPPAFGGSGVAAEDINNDGLDDILILSGLGNKLYVNRGNEKFEDITKTAGLNWVRSKDNLPGEPRQPVIADFNNDGKQDILITYVNDIHRVYMNLGNEKFEDVTATANLGGQDLVGGPATVFDFDNDGLLDIYITYFGNYLKGVLPTLKRRNSNGLPNRLFKNMGGFKFKDVTAGSNLDHSGWAQAVTHTDLDNDGLQDVIVGNDFGINAYFKNLGNGKFENITAKIGTDKPSYTMNIGLADLNDDLFPDIYISNIVTMNKDEKYVLPTESTEMKFNPEKLANMRVVEANDLFLSQPKSDKQLTYKLSQAVDRGYSSTGWSWDADFFDADNDGDEDLYVLNGMNEFNLYSSENPYYTDPVENKKLDVFIPTDTKESNVFFINDNGRFQNVSKQSGIDFLGNSRSAAYLDIDQDGDLDIVINNYHDKAVVYKNNAEQLKNNWLKIKLEGAPEKKINKDAIGAKIIITTESGRRIWREIHGSIGYMSAHPKLQHIGIGKSSKADLLVVWPNGHTQKISDLKANQSHLIKYEQ
ncbi:CRTAC1 family protein [uncultured Cocleimonas sp.]|uniref:CRTAC1 family protein n=1 Tax=uncultured Cocleimonas sp. TaxID=1051587 RepID=UPI00262AB393|nr:CRTAC1 family protein [uncultured Cocleimonas sp.]